MEKLKNVLLSNKFDNNPLEEIVKPLIQEQVKFINKELEEFIRNNAIPPIKGEITKGKLRYRKIKLWQQRIGMVSYTWVEQNGIIISEVYKF